MRVFLTGATGFVGSAMIPELIKTGHQIIGVTRSDAGAQSLRTAGVEVHRGKLEEPETLRSGAENADAVIHCAFDHNFATFVENCAKEGRVLEALGEALRGSDRPLLITSGTGMGSAAPGQIATEDVFNANIPNPRIVSEITGASLLERGVNVSVVRLPQVHDTIKQGLVSYLIGLARAKGVSAYIGEGLNRWAAGHVLDAARLYTLVLAKAEPGSRYHAVGEEGVSLKAIADAIGKGLNIPVVSLSPGEAPAHFTWLSVFAGVDMPASSALTQEKLNWKPTGPGLIADLNGMDYTQA